VRPEFRDYMQEIMSRYLEALEDDFSFPEAYAIFFEFIKYINAQIAEKLFTLDEVRGCVDMLMSFNEIFAIIDIEIFE
jgi:cysteinyl-tRNA synthetase